jgi:hypothetical protein
LLKQTLLTTQQLIDELKSWARRGRLDHPRRS